MVMLQNFNKEKGRRKEGEGDKVAMEIGGEGPEW